MGRSSWRPCHVPRVRRNQFGRSICLNTEIYCATLRWRNKGLSKILLMRESKWPAASDFPQRAVTSFPGIGRWLAPRIKARDRLGAFSIGLSIGEGFLRRGFLII